MIFALPLFALALSYGLTWFLRGYALKNKLALSTPRDRDLHASPTPRLGGLAIVASTLISLLLLASFADEPYRNFGFPFAIMGISIDKRLLGIIIATIALSLVMLKDDLRGVKPTWKLLAQVASAMILISAGVGITYLNNPFGNTIRLDGIAFPIQVGNAVYQIVLLADLFFIFWTVLLTNATNFIDGLDGLASSLSIIAGAIIAGLSIQMNDFATASLALIWAGAMVGFLPFNISKDGQGAKMFLGDTGSQFFGLMLAILTVISGGKLATILLVFGIVILDAIYVVAKRLYRGKNPFVTADRTHLHHRFLEAGFSKTSTLAIICSISLAFGLSALFFKDEVKIIMLAVLATLSLTLFIALDLKIRGIKVKNYSKST